MARSEQDREDLLREATALVERVELRAKHDEAARKGKPSVMPDSVVVGFRRDGAISFFFGAEPVYQFNAQGELRRSFYQGKLIKAERGRLVELERQREPDAIRLVRRELTSGETQWLADVRHQLHDLAEQLGRDVYEVVGQVPPQADVLGRVQRWLAQLPVSLGVARRPHAGG
jgi:hypothetical protein